MDEDQRYAPETPEGTIYANMRGCEAGARAAFADSERALKLSRERLEKADQWRVALKKLDPSFDEPAS